MKKMVICLFTLGFIISCSTSGTVEGTDDNSTTRAGSGEDQNTHLWATPLKLTEVHIGGSDTQYRRSAMIDSNGFFTLQFTASAVTGKGAPNSYSGPCTINKDGIISIMPMRSTLMASFIDPGNLKEHEFFIYVQNTYKRAIVNNKMELYSKTEDGRDVRLVFEP